MTGVTLRILDGADRGRVYDSLNPPFTIGREEGNAVQLNDERISRFHVKLQEDQERLVLTDLESTNGTKVNGEDVQVRILRFGDMISVGRSVLLFGSRDEIAGQLADLRGATQSCDVDIEPDKLEALHKASSLDFEINDDSNLQSTLHALQPPELPDRLSPGQAAQLSELLEFLHIRFRDLIGSVQVSEKETHVQLAAFQWQNLLDLQSRVAEYLRSIGDPGE